MRSAAGKWALALAGVALVIALAIPVTVIVLESRPHLLASTVHAAALEDRRPGHARALPGLQELVQAVRVVQDHQDRVHRRPPGVTRRRGAFRIRS